MKSCLLEIGFGKTNTRFGIYFALQILGAQGLGLISGEWRGVHGTPVKRMGAAVAILVVAAAIMACASTLT
jgi:hypothetical protein